MTFKRNDAILIPNKEGGRKMDQTEANNPSTKSRGQDLIGQPMESLKSPKIDYGMIVGIILACFLVFGFGGYYLGVNLSTSQSTADLCQLSPTVAPIDTDTLTPGPAVISLSPMISPTPLLSNVVVPGWKNYTISLINGSFQYPPELKIASDIFDKTELAADQEYWVMQEGTDIVYLSIYLYKSGKTPTEWWDQEGKNKFEKLAAGIEAAILPRPSINLRYDVRQSSFMGKEALEGIIFSDYETPHTPEQTFLTIVQHKGYIVMISYFDQGTTPSRFASNSLELSRQILSTFKFAD